MSFDTIIEVKTLGKCYQIYEKPHHRLMQMLLGRGTGRAFYKEFWALRDISFSISKGKVYGILGKNGAGKSTLLQLICGTLAPSHGEVSVTGRVSALLELGSGFNPEFTGVENIYMNAQILGFTRDQTEAKFTDILSFADIGDFVHQPVKTYSSGMVARLAFSVAIHVDPDILIVDEALSVGDAWFQHKSMARMRKLMESGCTVLFVSHSIDAVRAMCDEAIWLEHGQIKMQGDVTEVTNTYMNDVFLEHNRITLQVNRQEMAENHVDTVRNNDNNDGAENVDDRLVAVAATSLDCTAVLKVVSKGLRNSNGELVDHLQQGEAFSIEFEIHFLQRVKNISVGFLIKDQFGQELTGESIFNTYRHSLNFKAGQTVTFIFSSKMQLRGGQSYSVALRINQVSRWDRSDNVVLYNDEVAIVFDVLIDPDNPMWFKFKMPFEVNYQ